MPFAERVRHGLPMPINHQYRARIWNREDVTTNTEIWIGGEEMPDDHMLSTSENYKMEKKTRRLSPSGRADRELPGEVKDLPWNRPNR